MQLRWVAAAAGAGFVVALFVNTLGASAQERCGGHNRCLPDSLYTASGYVGYAFAAGLGSIALV